MLLRWGEEEPSGLVTLCQEPKVREEEEEKKRHRLPHQRSKTSFRDRQKTNERKMQKKERTQAAPCNNAQHSAGLNGRDLNGAGGGEGGHSD